MKKPKQLEGKSKKWNVIFPTSKGFIEALNSNRSFNVYSRLGVKETPKFYKSCYKLITAKKYLSEL